jgi:rubrerythrin
MVTLVGTQTNFVDALKELIELDYDAIEAYERAIEKVSEQKYKDQFSEFKKDHQRHVKELSEILSNRNETPPQGADAKKWLTEGKVHIAEYLAKIIGSGDKPILQAMDSNEIDTNDAYERMNNRDDIWDEAKDVLKRGLEDERRHKAWIEEQMEKE